MATYVSVLGGRMANPGATSDCAFCPIAETNRFLAGVSSNYADRWRNFGIMWAFVFFNVGAALFIYWLARVPKKRLGKGRKSKKE